LRAHSRWCDGSTLPIKRIGGRTLLAHCVIISRIFYACTNVAVVIESTGSMKCRVFKNWETRVELEWEKGNWYWVLVSGYWILRVLVMDCCLPPDE